LIDEGKVVLIDEYTGRRMPDRQLQKGLHQAIQTKENLPITKETEPAAQVTFQRFFALYEKLCGLTGTAWQNVLELRRTYKVWVVCVPTHRPVRREQWPDRVFPTEDAKFTAVVEEVERLHAQGRPVLIGTRSVERSAELSKRLTGAGLAHQVLNARNNATIATNMAGRGTDIKLGPGVADLGGLHVLGTERHEARRVDRQLAGRAGRQGDAGSCQFFLSLQDDLLEGLGAKRQAALKQLGQQGGPRNWQSFAPLFLRAQRQVERRHRRQRLDLVKHEEHRQEVLKDLAADPYVD
jgi:preprotein translocase subunit SecA